MYRTASDRMDSPMRPAPREHRSDSLSAAFRNLRSRRLRAGCCLLPSAPTSGHDRQRSVSTWASCAGAGAGAWSGAGYAPLLPAPIAAVTGLGDLSKPGGDRAAPDFGAVNSGPPGDRAAHCSGSAIGGTMPSISGGVPGILLVF